jgi:hypothetical protein
VPDLDFEPVETHPTTAARLRYVPLPLAGARRYQWKTLLVLAALARCRGHSATVPQIHTLVWAIADNSNAQRFARAWDSTGAGLFRGYTPDLLQILRVAQAEGLVKQLNSGRQKLTRTGESVLESFTSEGAESEAPGEFLDNYSPITTLAMNRFLGGDFS